MFCEMKYTLTNYYLFQFVVLSVLVAFTYAAPQYSSQQQYQQQYKEVIPIIKQTQEINPDGSYQYRYYFNYKIEKTCPNFNL